MNCGALSERVSEEHPRQLFYGRRRGRPLRSGQRELQTSLLPQLSFTAPRDQRLEPGSLFAERPREIWLEIGFGGGEHLAEIAAQHPDIGFIGCEVFENGIAKLLREIERRELGNIRIHPDDARPLLAALSPRSIGRVFILFPDPWPKARHHKRRLIAPATLDRLADIMIDGAELRLATDDPSYLSWMLEHVTRHPAFCWTARRAADWRERPPDSPPTRYEEKARTAGRSPAFLRFKRRRRVRDSADRPA